jgi:hypothetical protein
MQHETRYGHGGLVNNYLTVEHRPRWWESAACWLLLKIIDSVTKGRSK